MVEAKTKKKKCSTYEDLKPLGEFHKSQRHKDGRNPKCKECANAKKRENKEYNRTWTRKYRAAKPHIGKATNKQYYQRNREKVLRANAERRRRNPEKTSRERHASYIRHRPKILQKSRARHARIRGAVIVEIVDHEAVIARDNSTCYLCERVLSADEITLDHVVPVTRGGTHTADNMKVACNSCNAAKGNKLLSEYLESKGKSNHAKEKDQIETKEQNAAKSV